MTQEETLKRIEGEADKVADRWTAIQLRDLYRDGFIAGAKSERNKAIDDCIKKLSSTTEVTRLLESLKL